MNGAQLIMRERTRQQTVEGYDADHDDEHGAVILVEAGVSYAAAACVRLELGITPYETVPEPWPWEDQAWKPTGDAIRDLTKAGALIAAALDVLLRAQNGTAAEAGSRPMTVDDVVGPPLDTKGTT